MSVPGERGHLAICHLELVEWARRTGQGDDDDDDDDEMVMITMIMMTMMMMTMMMVVVIVMALTKSNRSARFDGRLFAVPDPQAKTHIYRTKRSLIVIMRMNIMVGLVGVSFEIIMNCLLFQKIYFPLCSD